MKTHLLLSFLFVFVLFSCKKDDDKATPADPTPTPTPKDTVSLPSTYLVIDSDTFYAVTYTVQPPSPNYYRYQVNYTSKDRLNENPNEPGANSIVGLVMTFTQKPTASASYDFTNERFLSDPTKVNFYLSYFINTGQAREGKNYLSPSSGQLVVDIANGKFKAPVPVITMSNEADAAETFSMSGVFDMDW
jgi:hypothetical protein